MQAQRVRDYATFCSQSCLYVIHQPIFDPLLISVRDVRLMMGSSFVVVERTHLWLDHMHCFSRRKDEAGHERTAVLRSLQGS